MNKRNDYRSLLKMANEDLAKFGRKIVLEAEDNTFGLLIVSLDGEVVEDYASGYYEDELSELVNDAWAHAKRS